MNTQTPTLAKTPFQVYRLHTLATLPGFEGERVHFAGSEVGGIQKKGLWGAHTGTDGRVGFSQPGTRPGEGLGSSPLHDATLGNAPMSPRYRGKSRDGGSQDERRAGARS